MAHCVCNQRNVES